MLRAVEQRARRSVMWLGEFRPQLEGAFGLSWPEWSAQLGAAAIEVPAGEVKLDHAEAFATRVRLWLVPSPEDGYLHLDLALDRPDCDHVDPTPWPRFGAILLLWGTVPAGEGEPVLSYLQQVEVER